MPNTSSAPSLTPQVWKIAACYIRVSTDEQVEYSPASQLIEIRKWASQNGYIVPDEYVFIDEGKTGQKVTGRDDFKRLIGTAKLKPKPFDAILLWKFSRFARNRDDAVFYKSILRKQLHIDVLSIKEPIAEGKLGILMEAMIEAMDEYYCINLSEDVKRGMEEKHRRGELQSTPSYGYSVEDGMLVPKEPEASQIREIFRRFCEGEGFYQIARYLNSIGAKTHRGNAFENRTVEYIIRNPVYIGKLRWNPNGRTRRDFTNEGIILVDGKHQALIDMDTWNAAQDRVSAIKAQWKYKAKPLGSNKDWISGLIRCASCGGTLIFAAPHYWKCNNYVRGRCLHSQHIDSDLLKDALIRRLQMDMLSSEPVKYDIVRTKAAPADELVTLRTQRSMLDKRLKREHEAYLAGADTVQEYAAAKQSIQEQIAAVDAELERLSAQDQQIGTQDLMRSALKDVISILMSDAATTEQKAAAIHSVVDHCTFSKEENLLSIYYKLLI